MYIVAYGIVSEVNSQRVIIGSAHFVFEDEHCTIPEGEQERYDSLPDQYSNAKIWRKDLADTINATNEQLGIAVHWEHRSFKEQGIDREPTIHIGAVANALYTTREVEVILRKIRMAAKSSIKNPDSKALWATSIGKSSRTICCWNRQKKFSCLPNRNFTAHNTPRLKMRRSA